MIERLAALAALALCSTGVLGDGRIETRGELEALLGQNLVLEHFEVFQVEGKASATELDVAVLDDETITNNQGPGLVEDGATYIASSNVLQWNGRGYRGLGYTQTLQANSNVLVIRYDQPVDAMGLDAHGYLGAGYDGVMRLYDRDDELISTVRFTIDNGGKENPFLGWQHGPGISRVELEDLDHSYSPIIDRHGYGVAVGEIYTLRVSGSCPGQVTVAWSGAEPNGVQGLVVGSERGEFRIPSGYPCSALVLPLAGRVRLVDPPGYFSTRHGSGSVSGNAGAAACGQYLILVQGGNCACSNVAQVP